jgi:CTP synthase
MVISKSKKYIFITGGVTSSLGKGLAAASIASLMERRGISVNMLKMDPYINVDPGTMSPTQHGEVFVTQDGAETDLDLGHYERFTSLNLKRENNFTSGQVYLRVIENEREGKYLGSTVQVVPHITDEIKRRIHQASEQCDLLIGEIGGTVGDIESLPFLEAIRQFAVNVGQQNVIFIHLVLVPFVSGAGELKSKPAQHSVKELRSLGLFPEIIICRADRAIGSEIIEKISLFCNVPAENVFESRDTDLIYKVPMSFHEQGLDEKITELLGIWAKAADTSDLERVIFNAANPLKTVRIAMVGKYMDLTESYKSLTEALRHAAIEERLDLQISYIDAQELEDPSVDLRKYFKDVTGILVPGGFGERGTEGKIKAIQYAREHNVAFFGICLGLQLALIEFARNVVGIKDAMSEEFSQVGTPVVHYMHGQSADMAKGASMRLGDYECDLLENSLAKNLYGSGKIFERHRHRLEVNNKYVEQLKQHGLLISGVNPKHQLVEVAELPSKHFFIGCQYHPEFKSKPFKAHPLFVGFLRSSLLQEKE